MNCEPGAQMKHLLLVDDEELVRGLIRESLRDLDLTITEASSGLEAVTLTRTLRPDLVLMDIVLTNTGIDGIEAARLIKRHPLTHHTKIMLMSGVIDLRAHEIERIGVDAVLSKPFKPNKLLRLVAQLLGKPNNLAVIE